MRPLLRSYGDISSVTLSPARMRMRCLRILPDAYAITSLPLASVTRKRVSGNTSLTVPSISISSSLGMSLPVRACKRRARPSGGGEGEPGRRTPPTRGSDGLQVHRRDAPVAPRLELERDLVLLGQRAHSGPLDGRDVHEHILRAVVGLDEPEAFGGVEELDGASCHGVPPDLALPGAGVRTASNHAREQTRSSPRGGAVDDPANSMGGNMLRVENFCKSQGLRGTAVPAAYRRGRPNAPAIQS